MEKYTLIDNSIEQRYQYDLGQSVATVEYTKSPGCVTLTRVFVPHSHEGQGVGAQLVKAVLEDLREKGLQIKPQCPFVVQYIARHPKWQELVL